MSHTSRCIYSDGGFLCTPDCTHDRDEARARQHRLACAVVDEWLIEVRRGTGDFSAQLSGALSALELDTRNSPMRKVKP